MLEIKKLDYENKVCDAECERLWHIAVHDLRTPLLSISMGIESLQEYMPIFIDAYNKARKHGLDVPDIFPERLEALSDVADSIKNQAKYCNWYLTLANKKLSSSHLIHEEIFKISDVIKSAISEYPDNYEVLKHGGVICNKITDFQIKGDKELVKHIIFNLLENTAYATRVARKTFSNITLTSSSDGKFNYFHYKDTETGIPKNKTGDIFNKHTSGNEQNKMGLGLYFSKQIMKALGGDIGCQSEEGKYTEFVLKFPNV